MPEGNPFKPRTTHWFLYELNNLGFQAQTILGMIHTLRDQLRLELPLEEHEALYSPEEWNQRQTTKTLKKKGVLPK